MIPSWVIDNIKTNNILFFNFKIEKEIGMEKLWAMLGKAKCLKSNSSSGQNNMGESFYIFNQVLGEIEKDNLGKNELFWISKIEKISCLIIGGGGLNKSIDSAWNNIIELNGLSDYWQTWLDFYKAICLTEGGATVKKDSSQAQKIFSKLLDNANVPNTAKMRIRTTYNHYFLRNLNDDSNSTNTDYINSQADIELAFLGNPIINSTSSSSTKVENSRNITSASAAIERPTLSQKRKREPEEQTLNESRLNQPQMPITQTQASPLPLVFPPFQYSFPTNSFTPTPPQLPYQNYIPLYGAPQPPRLYYLPGPYAPSLESILNHFYAQMDQMYRHLDYLINIINVTQAQSKQLEQEVEHLKRQQQYITEYILNMNEYPSGPFRAGMPSTSSHIPFMPEGQYQSSSTPTFFNNRSNSQQQHSSHITNSSNQIHNFSSETTGANSNFYSSVPDLIDESLIKQENEANELTSNKS